MYCILFNYLSIYLFILGSPDSTDSNITDTTEGIYYVYLNTVIYLDTFSSDSVNSYEQITLHSVPLCVPKDVLLCL